MQVLISDLAFSKGLDIATELIGAGVDPDEVLIVPHMEVAEFTAKRQSLHFRLAIVSSERTAMSSDEALVGMAKRVYYYNGETPAEVVRDVLDELLFDQGQLGLRL